jgi:hypothetical protein
MQLLGTKPEGETLRRWIYASLAILSAAFTTWALHITQESWRPSPIPRHEIRTGAETPDPEIAEIEALEDELVRIQNRLDELRSRSDP